MRGRHGLELLGSQRLAQALGDAAAERREHRESAVVHRESEPHHRMRCRRLRHSAHCSPSINKSRRESASERRIESIRASTTTTCATARTRHKDADEQATCHGYITMVLNADADPISYSCDPGGLTCRVQRRRRRRGRSPGEPAQTGRASASGCPSPDAAAVRAAGVSTDALSSTSHITAPDACAHPPLDSIES